MIIGRIYHFSASHTLPNHKGKCKNLHGHNYTLEVEIEGPVNEEGMVIDFGDLDQVINPIITDFYDHTHLNDILENPTAEELISKIHNELRSYFLYDSLKVRKLKLWENHRSYAISEVH